MWLGLCSIELAASFPNSGRLFAAVLGSASDLYPCGLVQVSRCIEAYLEALGENGLKPVLGENAMHRRCKILEGLSPPSRYCAYRRPRAFAAAKPFSIIKGASVLTRITPFPMHLCPSPGSGSRLNGMDRTRITPGSRPGSRSPNRLGMFPKGRKLRKIK